MAEDFVVKAEGDKRRLVINYKGRPYGPDIAQYPQAFQDVIEKLQKVDADEVVLSEYYERIYNEEQTKLLRGIADCITKFETESIWSPSHLGKAFDAKKTAERHDSVLSILNKCKGDPFGAYMDTLSELKKQVDYANTISGNAAAMDDLKVYLGTLTFVKNILEATKLVQQMRQYLAQLGQMPSGRGLYMSIFEVSIKPSFIGSRIMFTGVETMQLVDQYDVLNSKVYIYKHPDKIEYLYYINPPEYSLAPDKYFLLEKTKEVVAAHRPGSVGFMDMEQARKYFRKIYVATISDLAAKNNIELSVEEKEDLATIVARYTIGYGILEVILSDRKLTDVYIDSPLGVKAIYAVHSKYGQCQTNVIFSEEEARATVSRFRALSGRPFDEAHPILDFDLSDLQTRICTIGKPLAVDGTAFALRLHKDTPWTLCQFIDFKMFPSIAGGIFSFFVDAQASMLIVGSRGSGKTSFLQAMMQEIPQNLRIIVQEDTQELPVPTLKKLGFNIQRLKTRPPLGGVSEAEVSAEDALRTALRLGDSVLVVGEVRSSIRGSEEVIVVEDGVTKKIPIKDLEGKPLNAIQVPALDFDLKFRLKPLAGFVKHPERSKLVEITTKTGRKVTVTDDHSLFTATRDFKIAAIECNRLSAGDQLVIPARLPCGYNDVTEISVMEALPELRVENFEAPVRQAIAKIGWKQATQTAGVTSGDIYNYFRNSPSQQVNMPIESFKKLTNETSTGFSREKLRVKNGTSTPIPAVIPVNEELCRFLGYYISEGYYSRAQGKGGQVVLTNSNEAILSDMKFLSNSLFKINPAERKVYGAGESTQLRISSSPLALLVQKLGCGRTCTEKRVPSLVYGLSKNKVAAFLRALYSGDGCFMASKSSGNSVRYNTTSKKLVEDVAQLLLAFGIVARIYSPKDRPNSNKLWIAEFKDREMVETFLREIGFVHKKPSPIIKAWAHTKSNTIYFDKEALKLHVKKLPRKYRHLMRFERCSKNYLKKVVSDPACECSDELKTFALGEVYLDEITAVKEIELENPEPVYDLSVSPSQNFVGGFGGILLHNTEAKALYEAMRVGAVGNVVMGTIHGESAYSIWDRVVNDLGVPTTSFKATDMCIVSAPIRFKGSLKRERRVLEVTEVGKDWTEEPAKEGGFLQWMQFDAGKDNLELFKDNLANSEWLKRVQRNRGMGFEDIWAEINGRATYKQYLVDQKRKYDIPSLLEAENTVRAHNKYMLMGEKQREDIGAVEHESLLKDWRTWVDEELVRPLIALKKK